MRIPISNREFLIQSKIAAWEASVSNNSILKPSLTQEQLHNLIVLFTNHYQIKEEVFETPPCMTLRTDQFYPMLFHIIMEHMPPHEYLFYEPLQEEPIE